MSSPPRNNVLRRLVGVVLGVVAVVGVGFKLTPSASATIPTTGFTKLTVADVAADYMLNGVYDVTQNSSNMSITVSSPYMDTGSIFRAILKAIAFENNTLMRMRDDIVQAIGNSGSSNWTLSNVNALLYDVSDIADHLGGSSTYTIDYRIQQLGWAQGQSNATRLYTIDNNLTTIYNDIHGTNGVKSLLSTISGAMPSVNSGWGLSGDTVTAPSSMTSSWQYYLLYRLNILSRRSYNAQLTPLNEKTETMVSELSTLNSTSSDTRADVSLIKGRVASLDTNVGDIEGYVSQLRNYTEVMQSDVASVDSALSDYLPSLRGISSVTGSDNHTVDWGVGASSLNAFRNAYGLFADVDGEGNASISSISLAEGWTDEELYLVHPNEANESWYKVVAENVRSARIDLTRLADSLDYNTPVHFDTGAVAHPWEYPDSNMSYRVYYYGNFPAGSHIVLTNLYTLDDFRYNSQNLRLIGIRTDGSTFSLGSSAVSSGGVLDVTTSEDISGVWVQPLNFTNAEEASPMKYRLTIDYINSEPLPALVAEIRDVLANDTDEAIRTSSETVINQYNTTFADGNSGVTANDISTLGGVNIALGDLLPSDIDLTAFAGLVEYITGFFGADIASSLDTVGGGLSG